MWRVWPFQHCFGGHLKGQKDDGQAIIGVVVVHIHYHHLSTGDFRLSKVPCRTRVLNSAFLVLRCPFRSERSFGGAFFSCSQPSAEYRSAQLGKTSECGRSCACQLLQAPSFFFPTFRIFLASIHDLSVPLCLGSCSRIRTSHKSSHSFARHLREPIRMAFASPCVGVLFVKCLHGHF